MESSTPVGENQLDLILRNIKMFKPSINEETQDCSMNIYKINNFLVFVVTDKNDLFNCYIASLTLENFKLLSKYFYVCDDLGDILKSIEAIHNNRKSRNNEYVVKFSNDKIYYKTLLYTGKILEFEIKLNKYNKNKDAIIEQLEKKLKYYQRNG